jgi:hypothetical protein
MLFPRLEDRKRSIWVSSRAASPVILSRPEHENTNRIVGSLDPRQNSNRHSDLGSRGPAVARRNCYCAASLALHRSTCGISVTRAPICAAAAVIIDAGELNADASLKVHAPLRLCRRVALAETHGCRAERNFIAVIERDRHCCGFLVDESAVGAFKIFDTRSAV